MIPKLDLAATGIHPNQEVRKDPPSPRGFEKAVKFYSKFPDFWKKIPVHDLDKEPSEKGPFLDKREMPGPVVRGKTPSGRNYMSVAYYKHFERILTLIQTPTGDWQRILYSRYLHIADEVEELPTHQVAMFALAIGERRVERLEPHPASPCDDDQGVGTEDQQVSL